MQMFIAALFIIASNSKQPRHSSVGEWQTAVSKCNGIIFLNGGKKAVKRQEGMEGIRAYIVQ